MNKDTINFNKKNALVIKKANHWIEEAAGRPVPKKLFSELWNESEVCFMFATAGAGKTILGYQIANSIASGESIPGFINEAEAQPVLYLDFELTDKQVELRYSDEYKNHFLFHENFIRGELDQDAEKDEEQTEEEFLIESIEKKVQETGAKVLIIDNVTYISGSAEKAKDALPFMKRVKKLAKKYRLSILEMAHCPKRDESKPLTRNDLFGSVMQMNFCDSAFAIGVCSTDPHLRYLKQIKERNSERVYGADNVIVCEVKKESNFLKFAFLKFDSEGIYLRNVSQAEKEVLKDMARERLQSGKSMREIARELNVSHMTIQRWNKAGADKNQSEGNEENEKCPF